MSEETMPAQDRPQTQMESALDELIKQQIKLNDLVNELAYALQGALKVKWSENLPTDDITKAEEIVSPLVRRVRNSTTRTMSTQEIVSHLIKNLEV